MGRRDEFDGLKSHGGCVPGEFGDWHRIETPRHDRLSDAAILHAIRRCARRGSGLRLGGSATGEDGRGRESF
jgi:hypothetical protein